MDDPIIVSTHVVFLGLRPPDAYSAKLSRDVRSIGPSGDLPDGLRGHSAVQPRLQKYFLLRLTQITS